MADELIKTDETDDSQAAADAPTLEDSVDVGLEALRAKLGDSPDVEPVPVEEPTDDEPATPESAAPSDDDDGAPTIPSGHRRAAIARGWTDEEIDYYLETNLEEAVLKFEETYDKWQDDNSRYSERGRQLVAMDQTPGEEKEPDSEQLAPLDAQAIAEQYGNEELVNVLVGPLNKTIDKVNKALTQVGQSQEVADEAKQEVLAQVIQEFLGSKDMKPYGDVYGTEIVDLTDKQVANRMKMFGEADVIMRGAVDDDEDISVIEALERAHAHVSRGAQTAAFRQGIRDEMKKRTKTIPSSRAQTRPLDDDGPISEEELEARTATRQAALRAKA